MKNETKIICLLTIIVGILFYSVVNKPEAKKDIDYSEIQRVTDSMKLDGIERLKQAYSGLR